MQDANDLKSELINLIDLNLKYIYCTVYQKQDAEKTE